MPTSYTLPYLCPRHFRQIPDAITLPCALNSFRIFSVKAVQTHRHYTSDIEDQCSTVALQSGSLSVRGHGSEPTPTQLQDHSGQLPLPCTEVKVFRR